MRQITHSLNRTFQFFEPQFIQHQCKQNRGWEADNDSIKADVQGIAQNTPKIWAGEELLEVRQTDPCAAPDASTGAIVAECDLQAL